MTDSYPLREQRKQKTHSQLLLAADKVFLEMGYNEATLEQIATEAGMHVQTLYRHFPSKADLAAGIIHDQYQEFEDAFNSKQSKTLPFWRDWVQQRVRYLTRNGVEEYRNTVRERLSAQGLPTAFIEIDSSYDALLAEGIAEDMNVSQKSDRRPKLIAVMLWNSYKSTVRDWALSNTRRSLENEVAKVVDSATELIDIPELTN